MRITTMISLGFTESQRHRDYTPSPNRQWVRGPREVVAGLRPYPAMTGVRLGSASLMSPHGIILGRKAFRRGRLRHTRTKDVSWCPGGNALALDLGEQLPLA